jgi:protein arginine N-methyltransferase 1
MSLLLDSELAYLNDQARVAAFKAAIAGVVRAGDVVFDVRCGSGLLGLFACQAGARRVYVLNDNGMAGVAVEIARDNGFAGRVEAVEGQPQRLRLPEQVDVIVADLMGRMGYEAGIFGICAQARCLLRPGGNIIPARMEFAIAPVEAVRAWQRMDFWRGRAAGFNLNAAARNAANTAYAEMFEVEQFLAEPAVVAAADLVRASPRMVVRGRKCFEVRREGTLHGVAGWFAARLSPQVSLTNCPSHAPHVASACAFLPLAEAVAVAAGDRVEVQLDLIPAQSMIAWQVEVTGATSARRRHATLDGLLISRADLRRVNPDYAPALDRWGQARRTALNLCDGQRSTAAISAALLERHPDLFAALEDAAAFVGEVLMAYAR